MILTEIVALTLLLAGNLLVLRWLVVSDPADKSAASDAEALARTRAEPSHYRRAA